MIGYPVTSSITITAGAQSSQAVRRSARARSVVPFLAGLPAAAGWGAATAPVPISAPSSEQLPLLGLLQVVGQGLDRVHRVDAARRMQRVLDRQRDVAVCRQHRPRDA